MILTAVPGMRLTLRLAGTFDAAPGSDDYWYHVPSALTPHIRYIDLQPYTTGAAVLAPEALELVKALGRGTTQAWYPLDPAELSATDAETVVAQLRAFTANPVPVANDDAPPGSIERMTFTTSTIDTLETALATQSAMAAVFAITASGPVGAAVALIVAACRVIARSRRAEFALLSARGRRTAACAHCRPGTASGSAASRRSPPPSSASSGSSAHWGCRCRRSRSPRLSPSPCSLRRSLRC